MILHRKHYSYKILAHNKTINTNETKFSSVEGQGVANPGVHLALVLRYYPEIPDLPKILKTKKGLIYF